MTARQSAGPHKFYPLPSVKTVCAHCAAPYTVCREGESYYRLLVRYEVTSSHQPRPGHNGVLI